MGRPGFAFANTVRPIAKHLSFKSRGKIMNKSDYINKLQEKGFELLGRGLHSNVFAVPYTDSVIKVGNADEWPDYIQWSIQNGYNGKFAPKVSSLKFKDGYYVAIMERLVATISEIKNEIRNSGKGGLYNNSITKLANEVDKFRYNPEGGIDAPELQDFVATLKKKRLANDLHDGNIMVRKDGQLVVTDPVSNSSSTAKFRIKNGELVGPRPTQVLPHWYGN
jgi:hypothetical protein